MTSQAAIDELLLRTAHAAARDTRILAVLERQTSGYACLRALDRCCVIRTRSYVMEIVED